MMAALREVVEELSWASLLTLDPLTASFGLPLRRLSWSAWRTDVGLALPVAVATQRDMANGPSPRSN